jgi:glycosyltransferase involved in cell wall biosynthesis
MPYQNFRRSNRRQENPMHSPVFTVFTPTYNRGSTIHRVYDSLCAQTFRDFEWLIVDDTDDPSDKTEDLVKQWQTIAAFPIRYLRRNSRGKHLAWNTAVDMARGELFLSIDSDDSCRPESLQVFHETWQSIPDAERAGFTGVSSNTEDEHGFLSGTEFPRSPLDSDSMEIRYRFKVQGEKWGFHRTSVMREFKFPDVQNASYFPEFVLWSRVAAKYKTRFINRVLRVWYQPTDDKSRLTQAPGWANPLARMMAEAARLDEAARWFRYAPLTFLKSAINYSRRGFHAGKTLGDQWQGLRKMQSKALWLLALPLGTLAFLIDSVRKRARLYQASQRPAVNVPRPSK